MSLRMTETHDRDRLCVCNTTDSKKGRSPDKLGLEAATVATYFDDRTYGELRGQQC